MVCEAPVCWSKYTAIFPFNLRCRQSRNFFFSNSSDGQDTLSKGIHDRDVEDGSILAQEWVGQDGAQDGSEVAEGSEGVVQDGGRVLVES